VSIQSSSSSSVAVEQPEESSNDRLRSKLILKPELANGLSVSLAIRKNITSSSSATVAGAHCLYLILKNAKDLPLK